MGKTAFLFPGQGSQYVGMAKDFHEKSETVKELFSEAEEAIGVKISEIMFDGPVDALKQTDITQPAIYLHSVAVLKLLKEIGVDAAAGHSLGEFSAHASARTFSMIAGLKLVRKRGEAMLQAGIDSPGTMAAVIGLDAAKIDEICLNVSKENIVQPANYNSPGQIVISGSVEGVHKAMEECKGAGAKLVKELVVSGAFHSPLMGSAKEELSLSLESTEISDPKIPVYTNVTAEPAKDTAEIKQLLFDQLSSPVRWEETIHNMIRDGVTKFVEIGPGKVLQGLAKRIDRNVELLGIDKFDDLGKI